MAKEVLRFTVDSQLIGELGERLVSKNYIALAELIKNSYDADATSVKIIIENSMKKEKDSRITIIDNGHGMALQNIVDNWMRVATSNKTERILSPKYGRPMTGKKGVGRFACQRLAKKLSLESIAYNQSKKIEKTNVIFEWGRFKPGKELNEIEFEYDNELSQAESTGTTLILSDLTEKWTPNDFQVLQRHLLFLTVAKGIKRKKYAADPGISIIIESSEFKSPSAETNLLDTFKKAGWGRITARVTKNGYATVKVNAKLIGTKSFTFSKKYSHLNDVELDVGWISRRSEHQRNPKLLKQYVIKEIMDEYGGVGVYFNNFRIYPYGIGGNDWLNIDQDQAVSKSALPNFLTKISSHLKLDRPMLHMPRNSNLYGAVFIKGKASDNFEPQMDREGFVENVAYSELKDFSRACIDWATLCYAVYYERKNSKESKRRKKELIVNLKGLMASKDSHAINVKQLHDELITSTKKIVSLGIDKKDNLTKQKLDDSLELISILFGNSQARVSILQNVAAVNSIMLVFTHEARDLVSRLNKNVKELKRLLTVIPSTEQEKFKQAIFSLENTRQRFVHQMNLFDQLAKKNDDLMEYKLMVKKYVLEILDAYDYVIKQYKIEIRVEIDDQQKTPYMYEPEFYTLLINLISNAMKAVVAKGKRKIWIKSFNDKDGTFVLQVFDQGIGLSKKYWEKVFLPLESDPQKILYDNINKITRDDLFAFGQGTGLGLTIVRDISTGRNGNVHFIESPRPWKTGIEVRLSEKKS